MITLNLSLNNYVNSIISGRNTPPSSWIPYYTVDPIRFRSYSRNGKRDNEVHTAMIEVKRRLSLDYYRKLYPLQAKTLDYSTRAFPAYRYILPEVMAEDWLAVVGWNGYSRDHVLHQPLCGYIVLELLQMELPNKDYEANTPKTILDICVDTILQWEGTSFLKNRLLAYGMSPNDKLFQKDSSVARQAWRTIFKEAAYQAAVFHDIGYPWQYASQIGEKIHALNQKSLTPTTSTQSVIHAYQNRMIMTVLNGYHSHDTSSPATWSEELHRIISQSLNSTHGLHGALGYLHLNDVVRKYPEYVEHPLQMLCVEWISVAIMMHDMAKIYWGVSDTEIPRLPFLRQSIKRDPLAAIITLADQLQEFERPIAKYISSSNSGSMVEIEYSTDCYGTDLELDDLGNLKIVYKMVNSNAVVTKRHFNEKTQSIYYDKMYGYLNLSDLGINSVTLEAIL